MGRPDTGGGREPQAPSTRSANVDLDAVGCRSAPESHFPAARRATTRLSSSAGSGCRAESRRRAGAANRLRQRGKNGRRCRIVVRIWDERPLAATGVTIDKTSRNAGDLANRRPAPSCVGASLARPPIPFMRDTTPASRWRTKRDRGSLVLPEHQGPATRQPFDEPRRRELRPGADVPRRRDPLLTTSRLKEASLAETSSSWTRRASARRSLPRDGVSGPALVCALR